MHYYEVAPMRIIRSGTTTLTYSSQLELQPGQLVRIDVAKKSLNGVIIHPIEQAPRYEVKPISQVLDLPPMPVNYLRLAEWMSEYYATPLASVLQTMLPAGLHKKRRQREAEFTSLHKRKRTNFVLNTTQQNAVTTMLSKSPGTSLLHGVTGSGKTAVYIELAKQMLAHGKSTIVLVPEIALTSQVVAEFSRNFQTILLTHSRQTEAERHQIWLQALTAKNPIVVIGPRSALFLPLNNLGLIVIDESHEPSYKQEQSPRYHAPRVAHRLASLFNASVVLGSATPSLVDYYLAKSNDRPIITMDKPAVDSARKPTIRLVDMTKRTNFRRHRFLSDDALDQIDQDINSGKQVLLFHNRRGSAPTTLCEQCGWQAGCPNCFVPLTLHADQHTLRCHICNFSTHVPTSCPQCGSASIIHKGIGTKLIESELRRIFPKLNIARFDGDTASSETVEQRYAELYDGTIDIIVGTQVIAKGLDLPRLHSVIVVQADAGLSLPDYGASERTFQLLSQVIGRVGRSSNDTNVIVQSYQPTHPIINLGLKQDYTGFYESALMQRKRSNFPPFCFLLKLQCTYKTEAAAIRNTKKLADELRKALPNDVQILGPTPAFYERAGGSYRWQLIIKSRKRAHLLEALSHVPATYWQFELDPISLL